MLAAYKLKAKFHYASWFEAGCRQIWSWSATSFEHVCDQLWTSFKPASVMKFGFYVAGSVGLHLPEAEEVSAYRKFEK